MALPKITTRALATYATVLGAGPERARDFARRAGALAHTLQAFGRSEALS